MRRVSATIAGLTPRRQATCAVHVLSQCARTNPYLFGGLRLDRSNQVWCADITYLPMRRGFLYLVATLDRACRTVGYHKTIRVDQSTEFVSYDMDP